MKPGNNNLIPYLSIFQRLLCAKLNTDYKWKVTPAKDYLQGIKFLLTLGKRIWQEKDWLCGPNGFMVNR